MNSNKNNDLQNNETPESQKKNSLKGWFLGAIGVLSVCLIAAPPLSTKADAALDEACFAIQSVGFDGEFKGKRGGCKQTEPPVSCDNEKAVSEVAALTASLSRLSTSIPLRSNIEDKSRGLLVAANTVDFRLGTSRVVGMEYSVDAAAAQSAACAGADLLDLVEIDVSFESTSETQAFMTPWFPVAVSTTRAQGSLAETKAVSSIAMLPASSTPEREAKARAQMGALDGFGELVADAVKQELVFR